MEKILEIKNLTKKFGKKTVVNNLSFDIYPGEICGFLGPNGSGKTTTIKMVVGLLEPNNGTVSICNKNIKTNIEDALKNVGAIVENPDLYKEFSGRKNIMLAANICKASPERQQEVIDTVGLSNRIDEKVKKYSLGMKQRLGIAVALLSNPKLLIFDEPTNGLDPTGIKDFRETIKRLAHEEGVGVLISSHMMSEMELICDKIVIIEKGELLGENSLSDIKFGLTGSVEVAYKILVKDAEAACKVLSRSVNNNEFKVEDFSVRDIHLKEISFSTSVENIPNIVKSMVENGVEVWSVRPIETSLEDAYFDATGGGQIA